MLMTVNVGNSTISVGFFREDACELLFRFELSTDLKKTSDEYQSLIRALFCERASSDEPISGVILSSVVPQLTTTVCRAVSAFAGTEPLLVGPGVRTGFPIKIDSPSELGGDMVANAAAVIHTGLGVGGAILVDMGTVTTVSAISRLGEFVGCAIAPGVRVSLEALHSCTAQLPNVVLAKPTRAIGKSSRESVCSGVVLGNAMMLDGFVSRFASEMKSDIKDIRLVMTGEYGQTVMSACENSFAYDEDLTLCGLYYLYRNTVQNS